MTILTTFSELRESSITNVEVMEGSSDNDYSNDFITLTFDNGVVLEFMAKSKFNFKWNEWKTEIANSMQYLELKNAQLELDEFEENEELSYLIQLANDFTTDWEDALNEHLQTLTPTA
ncbi:hypothetical protein ABNM11_13460 [Pseudomonas syringae]